MNKSYSDMKITTRTQAFVLHLTGSVLIASAAAFLVFLLWYPWPLTMATGAAGIFLMLLVVDVITGPCLTFIVFNRAKKELKRDLIIVVLLQLSALAYGINAVFVARPVFYVFTGDHFELTYANELNEDRLANARFEQFKTLPLFGPKAIGASLPEDAKNERIFARAMLTRSLPILPQYYRPYGELLQQVQESIQALSELPPQNPGKPSEIKKLQKKYSDSNDEVGFLALNGADEDFVVIVRKKDGLLLDIWRLKSEKK